MAMTLELEWMPGRYAVCRLDAAAEVPGWAMSEAGFRSVTRTDRELSIIAPETSVPEAIEAERDWVMLRVAGTLEFDLVGILARLTGALADVGVSVFALSTYETDYLLVKSSHRERTAAALARLARFSDEI